MSSSRKQIAEICVLIGRLENNNSSYVEVSLLSNPRDGSQRLRELNRELARDLLTLLKLCRKLPRRDGGFVSGRPVIVRDRVYLSATHALFGCARGVRSAIPAKQLVLRRLQHIATENVGKTVSAASGSEWLDLRQSLGEHLLGDVELTTLHQLAAKELAEPALQGQILAPNSTIRTKKGALRESAERVLRDGYEDNRWLTQEEVANKLARRRDYVAKVTPGLREEGLLEGVLGGGMRRTTKGRKELGLS